MMMHRRGCRSQPRLGLGLGFRSGCLLSRRLSWRGCFGGVGGQGASLRLTRFRSSRRRRMRMRKRCDGRRSCRCRRGSVFVVWLCGGGLGGKRQEARGKSQESRVKERWTEFYRILHSIECRVRTLLRLLSIRRLGLPVSTIYMIVYSSSSRCITSTQKWCGTVLCSEY
jgi:hypothetical protein